MALLILHQVITGVITNILPRPVLPGHAEQLYPDELAALMRSCWQHAPEQRPAFNSILDELERAAPEDGEEYE